MTPVDSARRRLLGGAGLAAASLLAPAPLLAAARGRRDTGGYGPLSPVKDRHTGLALLELPAGFSYTTFAWSGDEMSNGAPIPPSLDGMGIVSQRGDVVTLIRNHEIVSDRGAFGPSSVHYDPVAGGGTVTIEFDLARGVATKVRPSLSGTLQNCAGGTTPWGSWLSCEEFVHELVEASVDPVSKPLDRLQRAHGFVFEVGGAGNAAEPLVALGQFRHEAAVVFAPTGDVYLTEDREPECGFYRFRPRVRGELARGGVLEMLKTVGAADMRRVPIGKRFKAEWVRIEEPGLANSPGTRDGLGVYRQGRAAGGAIFTRGEGAYATAEAVYFTCTTGGHGGCGQVFAYYPESSTLVLVYESPGRDVLDFPDNLCFSPRGGLVLCEDGVRPQKMLQGLSVDGALFPFARNVTKLDGQVFGHIGDYSATEWAGTCFSRDGRTLFANCYAPGFSVAITGPWKRGLI